MQPYIALLRGVNVGGKGLLKMADLKVALVQAGFTQVRTYIQSGNILFMHPTNDCLALARQIEQCIAQIFHLQTKAVVLTTEQWQTIITNAPVWWGVDPSWKHNLLVLIPPYTMTDVLHAIGELKPEIEALAEGNGVLYQSMSRELFGRTTTSKLASRQIYKQMTIRNYATAMKLLELC